jgi:hypothetical protein
MDIELQQESLSVSNQSWRRTEMAKPQQCLKCGTWFNPKFGGGGEGLCKPCHYIELKKETE